MSDVEELYDYRDLRALKDPTMIVARATRPTLVLGSAQSLGVVRLDALGDTALRRRRGGGGLVLLKPGDLWVDWWIPRGDERWSEDVHVSSLLAGTWWAAALEPFVDGALLVHHGALEGPVPFRVVCFAGRGPGEVFLGERKIVGVTQWRVREGVFLSSVLQVGVTVDIVPFLAEVPEGLPAVLDDTVLESVHLDELAIVERLYDGGGPWVLQREDVAS